MGGKTHHRTVVVHAEIGVVILAVGDPGQRIHERDGAVVVVEAERAQQRLAIFGLLGLALKTLPVGTAYAVWTGIGTVGTAMLGIWLLGEPATAIRLACIGLIVAGIAGLKLVA